MLQGHFLRKTKYFIGSTITNARHCLELMTNLCTNYFFKYCIGDAICQRILSTIFSEHKERRSFLKLIFSWKTKCLFQPKQIGFCVATEFTITLSRKNIRETKFLIFCSISLEQSHTKYETQNTVMSLGTSPFK